MLRDLYDYMMALASEAKAPWALAVVAFIESSREEAQCSKPNPNSEGVPAKYANERENTASVRVPRAETFFQSRFS